MRSGQVSKEWMRGIIGLPFYMSYTAPTDECSPICFDRNFNPDLKTDSFYFGNLDKFLKCVEKHAGHDHSDEKMNQVCSKEFKNMRLSAFKNELLYHNVNKRFYMDLLSYKRHESPM